MRADVAVPLDGDAGNVERHLVVVVVVVLVICEWGIPPHSRTSVHTPWCRTHAHSPQTELHYAGGRPGSCARDHRVASARSRRINEWTRARELFSAIFMQCSKAQRAEHNSFTLSSKALTVGLVFLE